MNGIIVTGHGNFASGMTSAMELIIGRPKQYADVDFTSEDSVDTLENKLRREMENLKECGHIYILTDLLSGSPFNVSIKLLKDYPDLRIVYGINLGMLMEICMSAESDTLDDFCGQMICELQQQTGMITAENLQEDFEEDIL